MPRHDIDVGMQWCRRCGRPMTEIIDGAIIDCDGLPGVKHARFLKAEAEMHRMFDPVVDRVARDLGLTK
jgi:hypothetical protein